MARARASERTGGLTTELKERCRVMRDTLRARALADEAEIAAYWPGGVSNPDKDVRAWVFAAMNLCRFLGRMATPASQPLATAFEADAVLLDALRGAPVPITVTTHGADDRPMVLSAYPKSMHALMELGSRDYILRQLMLALHVVQARADAAEDDEAVCTATDAVAKLLSEIGYQQRLCVWVVTHAGPGLPYEGDVIGAAVHEPPEWTTRLSPVDILLVLRAHYEANAARLAALQQLTDVPKDGESRPSWSVYFGSEAAARNVRPEHLLRDWSLVGLLASSHTHAQSQREAMARAEAANAKNNPTGNRTGGR